MIDKTLLTDRLILNEITESDADAIVEWRSKPHVYKYFKKPHRLTREEHLNWYRQFYLNNNNRIDWILKEQSSGAPIGVFGIIINQKSHKAEINYLICDNHQGKGYAHEALHSIILFANRRLSINTFVAVVHKENSQSIQFAIKEGFKLKKANNLFLTFEKEL